MLPTRASRVILFGVVLGFAGSVSYQLARYVLAKVSGSNIRRLLGGANPIARPPGNMLHSVAKLFCTKKEYERIVKPAIEDMRHEYCEALAERA